MFEILQILCFGSHVTVLVPSPRLATTYLPNLNMATIVQKKKIWVFVCFEKQSLEIIMLNGEKLEALSEGCVFNQDDLKAKLLYMFVIFERNLP